VDLRRCSFSITGIGGFIGLRLAEIARDRGAVVRGLELPGPAAERARRRGFEVVEGDVTRESDAARALARAEIVVHTAAIVGEGGDIEAYRRVNVGGTRTVAQAAKAAGARRFVHLSSVMVFGFSFPDGVAEGDPLRGEGNAYCQTKIESEDVLTRAEDRGELEITIIRPGDVYGPGSIPWVVRPIELMKQRLFVLPDGGAGVINHVHVDTLCEGVLLAVEREASGVFTLTDGAATTCREYFGLLARMVGRTIPSLPSKLLRPAFGAMAAAFRALGKEPPARPEALDYLLRSGTYSIEKARRELGYEPKITLAEGMVEVERWARRLGLV
jgi:nucleoside-diphosphate-sugar epimerase